MFHVHIHPVPIFAAKIIGNEAGNIGGANEAHQVGTRSADVGGLVAVGLRQGKGGHVTSIAPAADDKAVGMGHAHSNDFVDTGLIIVVITKAPIIVISMAKIPAIAAAAPGVGTQYGIPLLCESLDGVNTSPRGEILRKHASRATMDIQDEWISLSRIVIHRIGQESFYFFNIF